MHGYLSADIICSEKRTVFRDRSSRKTVCCEEQIISKDKYPTIFSPQMEATVLSCVYYPYYPRAKLEKTCGLLGTDNVQGQLSEHIFAPNGDYCLYYPSNLFRNGRSFENWGIFWDILQF